MVLAGIILSMGISALTLLITSKLTLKSTVLLQCGKQAVSGAVIGSCGRFVALASHRFFAMKRHRLLIFFIGDETAISVGIAVKKNESFRCC